jgi:hypothetical protein
MPNRSTSPRPRALALALVSTLLALAGCQDDAATASVAQALCTASQACPNSATISCSSAGTQCAASQDALGLYVQCDGSARIYCSCSCPRPADITYWVEPIDDGAGGTVDYGLHVCKPAGFTTCDVTVTLTTQSINGAGLPVTQHHIVWIAKNQTCNLKRIGHGDREVQSVTVDAVSCSGCTAPCGP